MSGDKPPILVVEDENVVAMDLVASLERMRYGVVGIAATADEAVKLAQTRAPALVLMDIHLRGGSDGIDAAERIQTTLSIPIVYLTAYSDEATVERATVTHPFGYVLKPFEDRDLEVAIQTALYRHKMEIALRNSERRLDAILESISDAVIATDADRRVTFLNNAAEHLLGARAAQASGKPLADVLRLSPRDDGLFIIKRGHEPLPVEISESPHLSPAGQPSGYVVVVKDVSERLRAQAAHEAELLERAARAAAEREQARAIVKSDVSALLAGLEQAADSEALLRSALDLIVKHGADWSVLHIEDDNQFMRLVTHRDPALKAGVEELVRTYPHVRDAPHGTFAVMRSGEPELMREVPDEAYERVARDAQHLAALRATGLKSYLCVPLRAKRKIIGALSLMSTDEARRYDRSDVAFAQQLADRIAISVENARLFREAKEARAEAEALFRIADALAESQLDLDALVQRVTDEGTALVGASFGAFFYNVVNEAGESYQLYTLSGAPRSAFERFGLPRNTPLFAPTFSGERVVRLDDVHEDPRYGKMPPHHGMPKGHLPVTSYLAVPVVSRTGAVTGGLFFGHPERARFTEQHERMAKALAAHAAVAIDNARLFTATRDAEERQSRLVTDLERMVKFSETFVGILGHDLRNPLSGVTTSARLIISRSDSERITTPAGRILSSAGRISRMIDQLLDFTHVRLGGGIPLERKETNLAGVCRNVIDELAGETEAQERFRLELRGDTVGHWDTDRVSQLLSNLAGNALRHGTPGGIVDIIVDGTDTMRVAIDVVNQGVVPPHLLPVIFEPLRPGKLQRTQGTRGLGLGLYISQQIVVAHGGTIGIESDEQHGTRVRVELPRQPATATTRVFNEPKDPSR